MEVNSDNIRKRVCKACDRCRLKKSKCDGNSPCSRCRSDNAICVFGERKKSQDKVYPKGYVEMLEQQQGQLVAGLRELYSRCLKKEGWLGAPLNEAQNGHPLTHDILERLDLLQPASDGSPNYEEFEEDTQKMQMSLIRQGAQFANRRGSISSESDHGPISSSGSSAGGTPMAKPAPYMESLHHRHPPTPPMTSPYLVQAQISPAKRGPSSIVSPLYTGALNPSDLHVPTDTDFTFKNNMYSGYDDPNNAGGYYGYDLTSDTSMILQPTLEPWVNEDMEFQNFLSNAR